jgi:hypothetical protein
LGEGVGPRPAGHQAEGEEERWGKRAFGPKVVGKVVFLFLLFVFLKAISNSFQNPF